ncbi:MAG: cytochrome c [Myxococcota bacterium]
MGGANEHRRLGSRTLAPFVVGAILLGAILLGCGSAPSVPARFAGPIQSADRTTGETAYREVCVPCHAEALVGVRWNVGRMRQVIREGSGTMAPIPETELNPRDLEALLAYLASIDAVVP